jgi:hypothetical protein
MKMSPYQSQNPLILCVFHLPATNGINIDDELFPHTRTALNRDIVLLQFESVQFDRQIREYHRALAKECVTLFPSLTRTATEIPMII